MMISIPRQKCESFLIGIAIFISVIFMVFILVLLSTLLVDIGPISFAHLRPAPPPLKYSQLRTGQIEVAKVFGRVKGCQDVDLEFVEDVNHAAVRRGLDPRIVAALIAVESHCDQFAVSNRGALGLMQTVPRIWKSRYDFSTINLLNRQDNLRVGTEILAGLVAEYGEAEGLRRYNGTGKNCASCDGRYTQKVIALANGRN